MLYKREHYFRDGNYFFIAICNLNVTMSSLGSVELFKLLSNASNIVNGLFYLQNSSDMWVLQKLSGWFSCVVEWPLDALLVDHMGHIFWVQISLGMAVQDGSTTTKNHSTWRERKVCHEKRSEGSQKRRGGRNHTRRLVVPTQLSKIWWP